MKKILSLIALMSITSCAFAVDWHPYGPVFVDSDSIVKTDKSTQGWIIGPQFPKSKLANRQYVYEAYYIDARCEEQEIATLNTAWLNKFHLREECPVSNISYIKIQPKTNNEVLYNALCKKNYAL